MRTKTRRHPTKKMRKVTTRRAIPIVLACLICSHLSFAGKDQTLKKHYGLIFGTVYGPDDRPLYGVKVKIYPAGKKHPEWEIVSDHRGEFAQRVPPGPSDYVVAAQAEMAPLENGTAQMKKKKRLTAEVKVHIDKEERQDVGLHLAE